jgi:glutaredoxin
MSEKKEKKCLIDNPTLMAEWDWEKNNELGLDPRTLTLGSGKKAWWKCSKGHEWQAPVRSRIGGTQGCPFCSNHRVWVGYNDLATTHPEIAKEWHKTKNGELRPQDFSHGSGTKVWWVCENGHEYLSAIMKRTNGRGCPYCKNSKISQKSSRPRKGSLFEREPELAMEWHPTKNGTRTPMTIGAASISKVWWLGACGHEWIATVGSRTNGNGCPFCDKEKHTSFPEQAIFFYIQKIFPDAISRYVESKKELDIYIPSIRLGIEYDGIRYHSETQRQKEEEKDMFYHERGISIIRIKENKDQGDQILITDNIIYYSPIKKYRYLKNAILCLAELITSICGKPLNAIDVDIERDTPYILHLFLSLTKENSVLSNAILADEWNYEKNGSLKPELLPLGSGKKVWWKCKQGHEWEAQIVSRNFGRSCPYCSNQRVLIGYNDLSSQKPELVKEWHPTKNGDLTPQQITFGSTKKVWWQCNQGHEWYAVIASRSRGAGCPQCSTQRAKGEKRFLSEANPTIVAEWHPTKNGELTPSLITCGSKKRVWWQCSSGHEWEAVVKNRTIGGTGCPICYRNSKR